jgi:hypothetical protein
MRGYSNDAHARSHPSSQFHPFSSGFFASSRNTNARSSQFASSRFSDSDRSSGSASGSASGSDDEFEFGRRFSSTFDRPFFVPSAFEDDDCLGEYKGNGRRTCSSTRFVNGQQIETRTVIEDGVKTITINVYVNGQLIS